MKTTKLIVTFALLLVCGMAQAQSQAQEVFFAAKAGMVQLYAQKNNKGKVQSYTRMTVKSVEGSGSNMTISYVMEMLDDKRKPQSNAPAEIPCTVIIRDNVVILDMNQAFAGMMQSQQLKMEITGVPMELPSNMQPGQSLKDANMTMSIDMGIMKMSTTINMTDGKCLAIENVTVGAGTFRCHKITQTVTTTIMRRDVIATTVSWYAPGVGTVKTESYNNKQQLQSSTELVEMSF